MGVIFKELSSISEYTLNMAKKRFKGRCHQGYLKVDGVSLNTIDVFGGKDKKVISRYVFNSEGNFISRNKTAVVKGTELRIETSLTPRGYKTVLLKDVNDGTGMQECVKQIKHYKVLLGHCRSELSRYFSVFRPSRASNKTIVNIMETTDSKGKRMVAAAEVGAGIARIEAVNNKEVKSFATRIDRALDKDGNEIQSRKILREETFDGFGRFRRLDEVGYYLEGALTKLLSL